MKIHNTHELRLRARSHAKNDHILQGTYGEGKANGEVEFKGCAIGCLSTPHRKPELRRFIRKYLHAGGWLEVDDRDQRAMLAKEFGICLSLARLAEGFFEAQPYHGQAINFVRDFAEALPEAANIRPVDCRRFARQFGVAESRWKRHGDIRFEEIEAAIIQPEEQTEEFLSWLRAGGRVSKMERILAA